MVNPEFMQIAEETAKESPCVRRKYGAVITLGNMFLARAPNTRVGRCCDGDICIRDRYSSQHGSGIEIGAELHAEATVLLKYGSNKSELSSFYLAGYDKNGKLLTDEGVWPCHYCALMIKFSGFTHVIIRSINNELYHKSIDEIMESWEDGFFPMEFV